MVTATKGERIESAEGELRNTTFSFKGSVSLRASRAKEPSMLVSITARKKQRLKSGVGIGSITSLLDWGVGVAAMDELRAKRASRGVRRTELGSNILTNEKLKAGLE